MTTQPLVFLSYAREDEVEVSSLYQTLTAAGFKPWLDKVDILPGEKWEQAIDRALRQAKLVLICLSSHSVKKRGWVQREIKRARDLAAGVKPDEDNVYPDTSELKKIVDAALVKYRVFVNDARSYAGTDKISRISLGENDFLQAQEKRADVSEG